MTRPAPLAALALLVCSPPAASQTQTVGLFRNDPGAHPGYTLFSPMMYTSTYLIDMNGELVHEWVTPYVPGPVAYLLPTGHLLRTARATTPTPFNAGGFGGLIQEWDWDGNLVWEFPCSDSTKGSHHDVEALPNGNVLVTAWVRKTSGEAIQAGRDPLFLSDGELWSDMIFELEPDGAGGATIVWQWDAWDHLVQDFSAAVDNFGVVADHPELIDINYWENDGADWLHVNSVDYNPDLDQIVLSVPKFDEFWIIDHSTTTAEAAGHTGGARGMGGDLLYRWGNPAAHRAGTTADQLLWYQHDVHWITPGLPGEGRILLYNNGRNRPEGNFSTVEEIVTTADSLGNYPLPPSGTPHGPVASAWIYPAAFDSTFYSRGLSGAERMPNGNTLVTEGATGTIFEIDNAETKYWEYVVPVGSNGPLYQYWAPSGNRTFRGPRYETDYPAFDGKDLTPQGVIELDPTGVTPAPLPAIALRQNVPNPFRERTSIGFQLDRAGPARLDVYDVQGRLVANLATGRLEKGTHRYEWRPGNVAAGVYYYRLRVEAREESRRMIVLK